MLAHHGQSQHCAIYSQAMAQSLVSCLRVCACVCVCDVEDQGHSNGGNTKSWIMLALVSVQ